MLPPPPSGEDAPGASIRCRPIVASAAILLAATLAGCAPTGTDTGPDPDTGITDTDVDSDTDSDTENPPDPPAVAAVDHRGGFLGASPTAVLVDRASDLVLAGTYANLVQFEAITGQADETIVGGLVVGDLDGGQHTVLDEADGLPTVHYTLGPDDFGDRVTSLYDLAWVEPGERFVATGYDALIRGDLQADGSWAFTHAPLEAGDTPALLTELVVAGGRAFVATDHGLASVDVEDFSHLTWIDLGSDLWVHDVSAGDEGDDARTPVIAALAGPPNGAPDRVAVFGTEATAATPYELPDGESGTTVLALSGEVLVGAELSDDTGAIYAVGAEAGAVLERVVGPGALTSPSRGPVVPNVMTRDAQRVRVLVGGKIVAGALGGPGGGLVALRYTPDYGFEGDAEDVIEQTDPIADLLPWQFDVLEVDAEGDLWFAGSTLCSEHRLRSVGLQRLDFGTETRLVRPWVSGVRDVVYDDGADTTWLALRDERPPLACERIPVQQSLCRLRGDGSCEVFTTRSTGEADHVAPAPGIADIALEGDRLALATRRDGLYVRDGEHARGIAAQIEPGLSLYQTAVAWDDDGSLWVGSESNWDPTLNATQNARGPHGLGHFVFDDGVGTTATTRYVRVASDSPRSAEVAGLPSNHVWDVLDLPGAGRALVALGIERKAPSYDHFPGAPVDSAGAAGVALVDGSHVTGLSADRAFTDVVALAEGADGTRYALDAAEGIYVVDVESASAELLFEAAWPASARARDLAVDASGRLAVASSAGVWAYSAEGAPVRLDSDGRLGEAWSVAFRSDGVLYAGGDDGLLRVALDEASLPDVGPDAFTERDPFGLAPSCIDEGCACSTGTQCGVGLDCTDCVSDPATGYQCYCAPADPCVVDPGSDGCACEPGEVDACNDDLACQDEGTGAFVCGEEIVDCGGVTGCECMDHEDCAVGYHCSYGIAGGLCAEGDVCETDCSCSGEGTTVDGCMEGQICNSMGPGMQECMDVPCEFGCECTGPGTTDGCPDGTTCQSSPAGDTCQSGL